MTTVATGHEAEVAAEAYLKKLGYKVLERNWRTRYCEIDIIVQKYKKVHFVEVKYRASDAQGSGLDYITPTKLRQMQFAAAMWVQEQKWAGDYVLSAIEVSGLDFRVTELIEDIS